MAHDQPARHRRPRHRDVAVHDLDGLPAGRDLVVVEEPLEVRVAGPTGPGEVLAVTMRTPGEDLDLAVGLCWGEGLLRTPDDLLDVAWCRDQQRPAAENRRNAVTVRLRQAPDLGHLARHLVMTSACGVCGRTSLDDLSERGVAPVPGGQVVRRAVLAGLPDRLRGAQEVFGLTGGLHAVARFHLDGELLDVCEDVGRHNAFDKLVGRAVRRGVGTFADQIVLLSGRASYELLAKAASVGAPVVASIGAPSSLAVDVADRFGITLVGFLRGDRGNVHTHAGRLAVGTTGTRGKLTSADRGSTQ